MDTVMIFLWWKTYSNWTELGNNNSQSWSFCIPQRKESRYIYKISFYIWLN